MALDHLEEEYINMELSSYSNLFQKHNTTIRTTTTTTSNSSSPSHNNPREFEFQMCSTTRAERDRPTSSPADELFYKGKLLPLHLPPRLEMVEKLLQNSSTSYNNFSSSSSSSYSFDENSFDHIHEFFSTPLMTTPPTPFESCNVSPSESFRTINADEYMTEFLNNHNSAKEEIIISTKKSPAKKLMKQSLSLGSKLKASRAYLKSLFGKSGCSDESSTAAMKYAKAGRNHKTKEAIGGDVVGGHHRRSFSQAIIRRRSSTTAKTTNSSSSSSSSSSSGSSSFSASSSNNQLKYLKRCGSANYSERESSIQGAIAHCKQSQQTFGSRSSLSGSRIGVSEEQERELLCRGY